MWNRFSTVLRCPFCRQPLELTTFAGRDSKQATSPNAEDAWTEDGLLTCRPCQLKYPIFAGLPIMMPYTTPAHRTFAERWREHDPKFAAFAFPDIKPVPGEELVARSFSKEWLEYDYDGVIWELDYADHETRFLKEVGASIQSTRWFLEVGCGLGLATATAQKHSTGDCIGLDISAAVAKAAHHFQTNPRLHFVQASAFYPPFANEQMDLIYSRGVLHHTFSTEKAFQSVAPLCRRGGAFYLWLYSPGSIWSTPLRVLLFGLEAVSRPLISRNVESLPSRAFIGTIALAYMMFNWMRRLFDSTLQPLNYSRAVHAARDRFTPKYAYRHSADEIEGWFRSAGYSQSKRLRWSDMPSADQADFRRNAGVIGLR